ncbi:MAG: hypothetical protein IIB99_09245, partial [Planctomycetes bacterium]|nr:hypothetical protein [Planctomycetota bacterium]
MRKIAGTRTIGTGLAASVLLTGAAAYGGSVLFVDDDAPSNGDGSTWKTAYRFLQDALANADGIEEIHVAQGTYRPDRSEANPQGSGDRGASFHLVNGLALQGGYAGIGADDPDARDIKVYETILSGDLLGDDGPDFANNDENSYQVVGGGGTNTTILDGFVITGGNGELFGGGMFIGSGSPMVVDCEFIENSAYEGGGLACQGPNSTPVISGCTFRGNTAGGGGGAIYILLDASPTITDCSFIENSSAGDAWWGGGAVYVWFAGVQLDRPGRRG